MCCLAYEQPAYDYLSKTTPMLGSIVRTPDGTGAVTEVNLVGGTLRVRLDPPATGYKIYKKQECTYLRGGKRAPVEEDPEPVSILDEE